MFTIFEPQERLKKYIQFYCEFHWKLGDPQVPKGHYSIPSGFSFMGFHRLGRMEVNINGKDIVPHEFGINRQNTMPYRMTTKGDELLILVPCLKPTALFHLFGKKLTDIINYSQDAYFLFGENFPLFVEKFKKTTNTEQRITCIEDLLLAHIEDHPWKPNIIDDAVDIIFDSKGMITIAELASKFNVSSRYFQKLFKKVIGITASEYRNIIRFVFVFSEMSNTPSNDNKTFVALFNFYDAAHFSKAFKKLIGTAPSDFNINDFPFLKGTSIDNSLWLDPFNK